MRGRVIYVIGVSGCGKSTVAEALAHGIDATFLEGDAFHSAENVAWMRAGHPLSDDMRWGWLRDLGQAARDHAEAGRDVLAACSALKRAYRDHLRQTTGPCRMLFLDGDRSLIHSRMLARVDHYMPATLLDSQFATLERPEADESDVVRLEISLPPKALIEAAEKLML